MGFLDKLLGNEPPRPPPPAASPAPARSPDQIAIERYRYMLKSAPPETLEEAHAEAFAKLTPEQRRQVLEGLAQAAPPGEQASVRATSPDDTQSMARLATREELRRPGFMERSFPAMGMGGSLLSSFAMGFVGSMVASSFFSAMGGWGDGAAHAAEPTAADQPDASASAADDQATLDDGNQDLGGGGDDFGGGDMDLGGGDF